MEDLREHPTQSPPPEAGAGAAEPLELQEPAALAEAHAMVDKWFPMPPDESRRVEALHSTGILDTPPQEQFDRVTSMLRRILNVPICLVSLVDSQRQWFKSNLGLGEIRETHRCSAFCAHAIMPGAPQVMVVHDALEDPRFAKNDLVTGEPLIRFYAGAPIFYEFEEVTFKLGTICVIDQKPRPHFSVGDKQLLMDMSRIVTDELILFKSAHEERARETQRFITCTAHDLKTPLSVFRLAVGILQDEKLTPTERSEILHHAELSCDMMSSIIDGAIGSARARWSSGEHMESCPTVIRIRDLVDDCAKIGAFGQANPVELEMTHDPRLPRHAEVFVDGVLLKRCLVNLISNAMKHAVTCQQGCVRIRVMLRDASAEASASGRRSDLATFSEQGMDQFEKDIACAFPTGQELSPMIGRIGTVPATCPQISSSSSASPARKRTRQGPPVEHLMRIEVEDNGKGVPPDLQSRMFREPFIHSRRKASDTGFVDRHGSGLGLYITGLFTEVGRIVPPTTKRPDEIQNICRILGPQSLSLPQLRSTLPHLPNSALVAHAWQVWTPSR